MDVVRGSGIALWRQIQEKIESDISRGALKPGARCPTEHALAAQFGVNRHTVRRAIASLEEKGLLRVEQGRGTFVREQVVDYPVRKRTRFRDTVAEQRRVPGGRLLHSAKMPADAAVADALDLARSTPVILVRNLGEVDGQPVGLVDHYFSAVRFPYIAEAYERCRSISTALAEAGVEDHTRKVTRVTARMPDRYEARHLNHPANRPLLISESINVDAAGRPIEYGVARFAGDRVQLVFEP